MKRIDGKQISEEICRKLKEDINKTCGRKPGLACVLVGEDPASRIYVTMKINKCQEMGIYSKIIEFSKNVSEKEIIEELAHLNQNRCIDGILVQQPLPKHLSTAKIIEAMGPEKDVDGFHPLNMGKLLLGEGGGFVPCTPLGIVKLLEKCGTQVEGKHVVIVGRSNIVGKPLALLLLQKGKYCNATVTVTHSGTQHLAEQCRRADILIVAIGNPLFIKDTMVKRGAVVIDVGMNRIDKGIVGDVDFESVKEIASKITPVPGGVGPMTIAMLLSNTYKSFKRKC